ncbi:MAG: Lrp/AsnC family transcriptional regulator [Roseiarcus sp.]|jgi:Lrp/AsnC family transcriptional regulator, leucine-responsive regulatory protein
MKNLKRSTLLSDPVHLRILKALSANPRIPNAELARTVGMSGPAVRERVQRLQEAGLIRGIRLDLDPKQLGYPVAVMVRVRPMPGQLHKIIELARGTPRVVECCRITGEDCFVMRLHLESIDTLDSVLDAFLLYGQTTTSIIQSSPVPLRSLPLPNGAGPS